MTNRKTKGAAMVPPLAHFAPFPKAAFVSGLAALVAFSLLFAFSDLDLRLSSAAYAVAKPNWFGQDTIPFSWLYKYGQQPSTLAGLLGFLVALLSLKLERLKPWRGCGLYMGVLLLLGPGLLVNVFTKNLCGRPRPSDCIPFGGSWEFQRVFEFGMPGRGKSFLSGHSAAAFYWTGLFFVFSGAKRWLGLALGLGLGLLMCVARVTQGGPFASDTLICGAAIFSLAAGLSPLIDRPLSSRFFLNRGLALALGMGVAGWLLIANPIYEERVLQWGLPGLSRTMPATSVERYYSLPEGTGTGSTINAELQVEDGMIQVSFDGENAGPGLAPFWVHERFWASLLPGAKERFEPQILASSPAWPMQAGDVGVSLIQRLPRPFWRAGGDFELHLPGQKACEARLKSRAGAINIGALPESGQVLLYGTLRRDSLPEGFEPYGLNGYHKGSQGPLWVLHLDAPEISFTH